MKDQILEAIRDSLRARLERLLKAAREAHEAATDPGSRAESKYDTRTLEASYLASGQARQVEDLSHAVRMFERLRLPDFAGLGAVGPGALVQLRIEGEDKWFLLVPAAGGLEVSLQERMITLLSPESPLYQQLLGLAVGELVERPRARILRID